MLEDVNFPTLACKSENPSRRLNDRHVTREDMRKRLNVGRIYYIHVNEGFRSCESMPRPSRDEYQRHFAKCSLSERERA